MMHGTIRLSDADTVERSTVQRIRHFFAQRMWLLIVVFPTLLVSIYYGLVAADQYESEAHFIVRSTQSSGQPQVTGVSAALSMLGGSASTSSGDSASVSDYLDSHDAVAALARNADLVGKFRRPEADFLSRLSPANPTPERLLKYYERHVDVKQNPDTGITTLRVRAFRPGDSYELMNALLKLGEQRVNMLNRRAYESSVNLSKRQLVGAEQAVAKAQANVTAFRQGRRNIDPVATGQAQIELLKQLQVGLAQARAQQSAMAQVVSPSSPQYRTIVGRVRALDGQVSVESRRLSGGANAIAANVGDYQGLLLRQTFASKRYDDAAAAVARAVEQSNKQQLFVVRVVEPNMPVRATYPKAAKIIFTVFVALGLAYALGWLIVAGVREHSA